jgi:hypothetical protein
MAHDASDVNVSATVTNIEDGKKSKKKPGRPRKEKPQHDDDSFGNHDSEMEHCDIQRDLIDYMAGEENDASRLLPEFGKYISCKQDEEGSPILFVYDEFNNTVRPAKEDTVAWELFYKVTDSDNPYKITYKQCCDIVSAFIIGKSKIMKWPKHVAALSDPEMAFKRLDFDFDPNVTFEDVLEKCPIVRKHFERSKNAKAKCARVGSLFHKYRSRKQIVWMHGETDGGKSFFIKILREVFGEKAIATLTPKNMQSQYYKQKLVGAAITVVNEAHPGLIRSDEFKSLTGDSIHAIERKHRDTVDAVIDCVFFFVSNKPPLVQDDAAIKNRIISCAIDPIPEEEQRPEEELLEDIKPELPTFLSYCYNSYLDPEIVKNHRIICDMSEVNESSEEYEMDKQAVFDKYFEWTHLKPKDMPEQYIVESNEFTTILNTCFKTKNEVNDMRDFLRSKGCKLSQAHRLKSVTDREVSKVVTGIKYKLYGDHSFTDARVLVPRISRLMGGV